MVEYFENVKVYFCVEKIYNDCKEMVVGNKLFDWGMVEIMVYVILLDEGMYVCIFGEDVGWGIFFYCYVVVYN